MNVEFNSSNLVGVKEIAQYLGYKESTIYSWIHQKRIPYIKIGRNPRFNMKDISDWLEKHIHKEKDI